MVDRSFMSDAEREGILHALNAALREGGTILRKGGSSVDAVEAAIVILEDAPQFNAGKGSVFNAIGKNEVDASIMDGNTLQSGAVAGAMSIRNPIQAARLVIEHSPHVYLQGAGADDFAAAEGVVPVSPEYFYTDRRWNQLQEVQDGAKRSDDEKFGTVGAVALDRSGNLAAGTSTGGLTKKCFGRVGDSSIIGAGTYAQNDACAVSGTGEGEYFIRLAVAKSICSRVVYGSLALHEAVDATIAGDLTHLGGFGGVIAIDRNGTVVMRFNTKGMYRGSISSIADPEVAIYE